MEIYIAYAVLFFLALYGPALMIISTIIGHQVPRPYNPSGVGVAFAIAIIFAGFYKLNDFVLVLALMPFGASANSTFRDDDGLLITFAFFQAIGLVYYVGTRLGQEDRWKAIDLKALEAQVQSQSFETRRQQEEAKIWKDRSEKLQNDLDNLQTTKRSLDRHYDQLLTKNRELQEDVSFLERNASTQTIEALEKRREERKTPWIFDT